MRAEVAAQPEQGEDEVAVAEGLVSARVLGNPVLEHENADQHEDGDAQHDDLDGLVTPRLLRDFRLHAQFTVTMDGSHTTCRICRSGGLRGCGRRLNVIRVGDFFGVGGRQVVIHIKGDESLVARAGGALYQEFQLPRAGGIQRLLGRHGKERDFREMRRTGGHDVADAAVVAVTEVETVAVLLQFQTVKNPAAHIA